MSATTTAVRPAEPGCSRFLVIPNAFVLPATLEVPCPERLSRRLVLVKSWLLAILHLIVAAIFAGGLTLGWAGRTVEWPGLIGLLTLVAGVMLLFRNRYPDDLHRLIVGLNRWVYRVAAYVALMRDEYPPFRLDR